MRIYYHFDRFRDSRNSGSKYLSLDRWFEEFCRKHIDVYGGFYYPSWDGSRVKGIYAYEENGDIYEFFSGYNISDIVCSNGTWHYNYHAKNLSAGQFASEVGPYMRYKDRIGRVMHEYFDIQHRMRLEEIERQKKAEEKERKVRGTYNASWLESFLNNR